MNELSILSVEAMNLTQDWNSKGLSKKQAIEQFNLIAENMRKNIRELLGEENAD